MRNGGSAKEAARAARASLRDAHRRTHGRRIRRLAGAGTVTTGAWLYGQLHEWAASVTAALYEVVGLRRGRKPGTTGQSERPRIESTVDRPANPAAAYEPSSGGASTMAGGAPNFVTAAEELGEALARYEPPEGAGGMVQFYSDVGMLPDALEAIARGFGRMSDRAGAEWPLHQAISELIAELAKVHAHASTVSTEIKPAIAKLHEADLERHRAPRPSEVRWDVGGRS